MKDRLFPYLTGVLCFGMALLAIVVVHTRYHLPKNVAHLSDVSAAVTRVQGTGAVTNCQAAVTSGVESSGGDRPNFGQARLVPNGSAVDVYIHVNSSVFVGWAECKLQKSVWQVIANGPSGPPPASAKPSS